MTTVSAHRVGSLVPAPARIQAAAGTALPHEAARSRHAEAPTQARPTAPRSAVTASTSLSPSAVPHVLVEILPPLHRRPPAPDDRPGVASEHGREAQADDNVIYLRRDADDAPAAPHHAPGQPPRQASHGTFTPFLAQQLAQEVVDPTTVDGAQQRYINAAHSAYRQVAGDDSTLLGPVRTATLTV